MKLDKLVSMTLAMLLLLLPLHSLAEITTPVTLQGLITAVYEGYFLMSEDTYGSMRINIEDTVTVYEGTASKDTLAVGQYVFVTYDGVMTRSMPPQVTALKIGCYVLAGIVTAILEGGVIVEGDEVLGTVIAHIGDGFPAVYQNVPITIYYSGVMALSMPPQINASHIVVPMLEGTVSGAGTQGFTLTGEDGSSTVISVDSHTVTYAAPMDGDQLRVYFSGETTEAGVVIALEIAAAGDVKIKQ